MNISKTNPPQMVRLTKDIGVARKANPYFIEPEYYLSLLLGDLPLVVPRWEDVEWWRMYKLIESAHNKDSQELGGLRPEDVRWFRNHVHANPAEVLMQNGWPKPKEPAQWEKSRRKLIHERWNLGRVMDDIKNHMWYPYNDGQWFSEDFMVNGWDGERYPLSEWQHNPRYDVEKEIPGDVDSRGYDKHVLFWYGEIVSDYHRDLNGDQFRE